VIVTAPGQSSDFVSRFFAPAVGVDEDPVTGVGTLYSYPVLGRAAGKNDLFARQVSKRGGELYCELRADRVKIGGKAALYMKRRDLRGRCSGRPWRRGVSGVSIKLAV